MNVHYSILTGAIVSWGSADCEDGQDSHFQGCKVLVVPLQNISHKTHKVDLETKTIVSLNADEIANANAPSVGEVAILVARELANADRYMVSDFPINETERQLWRDYRKALRDCSKNNATMVVMLGRVPSRPDGIDPAATLRSRIVDFLH